jgi:hypothetical protein
VSLVCERLIVMIRKIEIDLLVEHTIVMYGSLRFYK